MRIIIKVILSEKPFLNPWVKFPITHSQYPVLFLLALTTMRNKPSFFAHVFNVCLSYLAWQSCDWLCCLSWWPYHPQQGSITENTQHIAPRCLPWMTMSSQHFKLINLTSTVNQLSNAWCGPRYRIPSSCPQGASVFWGRQMSNGACKCVLKYMMINSVK